VAIQLDRKHLLAYGLAILLSLGLVYSIESRVADRAEAKASAAEARAELIQQQNTQFQASVQKQLDALTAANVSLQSALISQKKIDAQLPPAQLGNRLADLSGVKQTEVALQPTGNFELTSNAVLQAALKLEEVPVLTTELANETKALDLEKQAHLSDLSADNAALVSCKADLTATKAKARRSKLKWFGAGVVVGFIGRTLIP